MNLKLVLPALFLIFLSSESLAQNIDTLVYLGTNKMHFNIWEGIGTPILFESGGGNDARIWNSLVEEIHEITGATIITYDRVGYGQSEFNPALQDNKKALITNGIAALEDGLKKLGLFDELILVAHSYGGYYATYLASQNPTKIKGILLLDVVLSSFHNEKFIQDQKEERTRDWLNNIRSQSEALYFECLSNLETIEVMKSHSIPSDIPVIDIVAENPPYQDLEENERWKLCHQEFVRDKPNWKSTIASNCSHYLHFDNPKLAVDAVVSLFSEFSSKADKSEILKKYLDYSAKYTNVYRQQEYEFWHSERDVNRWGYSLIAENKLQAALNLFELNTILHPESFNVWDSYAEILLLTGDKEAAIKMYNKSLEINPANNSATEALKKMED